jgi:hypothetical protein
MLCAVTSFPICPRMTSAPKKVRRLGPYSRPAVLAKLDQRTKEARILHDTREALTAHVGGSPSAVELALIERACALTLHLAQLDAKMSAGDGFTEHDSRYYICWSNALTRTLARLGTKGSAPRPPSLAEHLARKAEAVA